MCNFEFSIEIVQGLLRNTPGRTFRKLGKSLAVLESLRYSVKDLVGILELFRLGLKSIGVSVRVNTIKHILSCFLRRIVCKQ